METVADHHHQTDHRMLTRIQVKPAHPVMGENAGGQQENQAVSSIVKKSHLNGLIVICASVGTMEHAKADKLQMSP